MAEESSIINNLKVCVRKCQILNCDKIEIYNGTEWLENWHKYNNGYICKKHYSKQQYDLNPNKKIVYSKTYQQKNRVKQNQYVINHYIKIHPNRKPRSTYVKKDRKKYKDLLLEILGSKCIRCGFTDSRALQFDHINDDGYVDRKLYKHQRTVLAFYYKNPQIAKQKLQVLCANCNWIKRFEINKHNQYNR